jgi:heme oxygenase
MPTGRPEIVDRLRDATRDLHAAVEEVAAVTQGGLERYLWFVARQYGFTASLEPLIAATPGIAETGLDLEQRRRAHLFAADLLHFGIRPGNLPRCVSLPRLGSAARALGALYVLEGSTLGGAFLLAHLSRTLGITPAAGGSGLAPYGHALREMWVAYADALDGWVRGEPGASFEVVDAAKETFARMLDWMRAPAGLSPTVAQA